MGSLGLTTSAAARVAAMAGAVLALGLVTGCGGGDTPDTTPAAAGDAVAPVNPGPPATLKQLANRTGCKKPEVQTDADELRQGVCKTSKGQYTVTTFASDDGKQQWLDEAKKWGGSYLVGTRWVIAGNDTGLLQTFSEKVGGNLVTAAP
ncbi:hypothetical protein [Sphaerisporangium aureirubrum]|uniref:Lipoprotein n=1 Tax=Sphaerisporangium aureirubrum TaxID=1544736 RepID=A0ABW1NN64_9ACTN